MFDEFEVNSSSRRDLRFMLEVMKNNNQIHDNIGEKIYRTWVNDTFELEVQKLGFTNFKDSANSNRLSIYHMINQRYKTQGT